MLCWIQIRCRAIIISWGWGKVLPSVLEVVGLAPNGATPTSWSLSLGHRRIYLAQTLHSISTGGEASGLTQLSLQVPVCSTHLLLNLALELISVPRPPSIHAATAPCSSGRAHLQSPLTLKSRSEAAGMKARLGSVSLWTFCSAWRWWNPCPALSEARADAFVAASAGVLSKLGGVSVWQPYQGCGSFVPVPTGCSGEMPQHGGTCWVPRTGMCCDRVVFSITPNSRVVLY